MFQYLIRRLLWVIPVLFSILVIVFLLMHALPGGPWDSQTQRRALNQLSMDPTTMENLNKRYGLNEPLWKQFTGYLIGRTTYEGEFLCGLICGDMGPSYRKRGLNVQDILFAPIAKGKSIFETRFLYSLRLSMYAFLMAIIIGLPLGMIAAVKQGTWIDLAVRTLSTALISLPNFVIGLIVIIVLGGSLRWITISPKDWSQFLPRIWFAPIFILGIGTLAAFIRLMRSSLLEIMRKDYVRTARGKGAREQRVVIFHMLKNAMIPVITFSGPALLELFAGSFVIESMFGYPGMGSQFVDSIQTRDYSMIMGVMLVYALMIAGVNILIDIFYGAVDPRIRVE